MENLKQDTHAGSAKHAFVYRWLRKRYYTSVRAIEHQQKMHDYSQSEMKYEKSIAMPNEVEHPESPHRIYTKRLHFTPLNDNTQISASQFCPTIIPHTIKKLYPQHTACNRMPVGYSL